MAIREARGRSCLKSSTRLAATSFCIEVTPVTFPPGRARAPTRPTSTGSTPVAMTIGIELVARLAARAASVPAVAMMLTLALTSSPGEVRQPSHLTFSPARFIDDVLALHISQFTETVAKGVPPHNPCLIRRGVVEKTDLRHLGLCDGGERRGEETARDSPNETPAF